MSWMGFGGSLSLAVVAASLCAHAQSWDLPARAGAAIAKESKFKLTFESRGRYESRTGNGFGKDPDLATGLFRTRVGLTYSPAPWLKFAGAMQDARAPWYGPGATTSVCDEADLFEAYVELRPSAKSGFSAAFGRMAASYGDGRLIGTANWGNVTRPFDLGRARYRWRKASFEALVISPVKLRMGEFNRPVPGDRIWGTYNSFTDVAGKNAVDAYVLRREQNRPGGYTGGSRSAGTDKIGVTTAGIRVAGPLPRGAKYVFEGALQRGKVGPAGHSAAAWVGTVSRRWTIGKRTFDGLAEYKYASGTRNPSDASHSGTFDLLYPSNHDRFGHQDLFGWRNIHNIRAVATYGWTKQLAVNLLYSDSWLASAKDSLYSGSGKSIARSAAGVAGRHIGREADLFATYKYSHFQFGAGYGYFFCGDFVRKTTPGVDPTYVYLFHTYAF